MARSAESSLTGNGSLGHSHTPSRRRAASLVFQTASRWGGGIVLEPLQLDIDQSVIERQRLDHRPRLARQPPAKVFRQVQSGKLTFQRDASLDQVDRPLEPQFFKSVSTGRALELEVFGTPSGPLDRRARRREGSPGCD